MEKVMRKKMVLKVVIGVLLIGSALGYFIYQAMQSSWSYYYSVDEFAESKTTAQKYSFRIAGRVQKGSVKHDMEKMNLTFVLSGSKATVPVVYNKSVPDNFEEGREVVVQGRLDTDGVFQANKLMTKCESKYKAKID